MGWGFEEEIAHKLMVCRNSTLEFQKDHLKKD